MRRKLLLIVPDISQTGGIERVISTLMNYIVGKYNYEVEIISLYSNEECKYGFNYDINIKITHCNLKIADIKSYKDSIKYNFKLVRDIKQILKSKKYDIVITFNIEISIAACINRNIIDGKLVITEHSDYYYESKLRRILRRITYNKADQVVLLTKSSIKEYQKFIDNNKISIIPNSVPFKQSSRSNQNNKKIVWLGRLEPVKSIDHLIDIFYNISLKNDAWRLEIVGDGS